jgi:hypothetical protein
MAKKKTATQNSLEGTIMPAKTLFFRVHVGEAKDGKKVYEMSLNVGGSVPIIHSKTTGKWFVLSWPAIITMAVKAGIDIPDPEVDKPDAIVNPKVDKKESKDAKKE